MEDMKFTLGEDCNGKTLIIWQNPPGLYADFYPKDLKHLAEVLLEIAEVYITENP